MCVQSLQRVKKLPSLAKVSRSSFASSDTDLESEPAAQVALPSALIGGAGQSDPHIRDLHDRLQVCNRRIVNNELNLPPEGERSPSPQPIYDRNGIRLNTREVGLAQHLIVCMAHLCSRGACCAGCAVHLQVSFELALLQACTTRILSMTSSLGPCFDIYAAACMHCCPGNAFHFACRCLSCGPYTHQRSHC